MATTFEKASTAPSHLLGASRTGFRISWESSHSALAWIPQKHQMPGAPQLKVRAGSADCWARTAGGANRHPTQSLHRVSFKSAREGAGRELTLQHEAPRTGSGESESGSFPFLPLLTGFLTLPPG